MTPFALLVLLLNLTHEPGNQVGYGGPVFIFETKAACEVKKATMLAALADPETLEAFGGTGVSWYGAVCVPAKAGGVIETPAPSRPNIEPIPPPSPNDVPTPPPPKVQT